MPTLLGCTISTTSRLQLFDAGSDEHDMEVHLMDAGADDYIRQPIDPPEFLARAKAALRRAGVS